jgi:hypothetical protein
MKTWVAFIVFVAAVLSAGSVFAQQDTPQSYRQALLAPDRALAPAEANFCQQKTSDQNGYADCQVTLNFLKDIILNQSPSDSVCPLGANIQYAGNPTNQNMITKRCT